MDKKTKLLFLLNSIEDNLQVVRDAIMEEIWDKEFRDRRITDKDLEWAIASIRNNAHDYLSKKDIDGDNGFSHSIEYFDCVTETKDLLCLLAEKLKEEGIDCYVEKYNSCKNYLVLDINYADISCGISMNFSSRRDIQLFFDNYLEDDTPNQVGRRKEYYKIPFVMRDIITDIVKMERPTKVSEIPVRFHSYRQ